MSVVTRQLLRAIKAQFKCDWHGHHGVGHWYNVARNARELGGDRVVTDLFAVFHDAGRINEYDDPEHGHRGAKLAFLMRRVGLFKCTDDQFDLLDTACRLHSDGLVSEQPTIVACWDADRLDLGRVGITPDKKRLCGRVNPMLYSDALMRSESLIQRIGYWRSA